MGNLGLEAMATHELGAAVAFRGEHERAIELCLHAVEVARRSGMRVRLGFALGRLAQVYMVTGRLEQAEPRAAEAVRNVTQAAGPLHRARILLLHALILEGMGRVDAAQRVLRNTAEIVAELDDVHLVHERVDEELEAPVLAILRDHLDAVLAARASR